MLGITMLRIAEDQFASEYPETSRFDATAHQIARAGAFLDCSLEAIEHEQRRLIPFRTEAGLAWAGSGSPPSTLLRQARDGDSDAQFDLLVGRFIAGDPAAERELQTAALLGDPDAAFMIAGQRFNEGALEVALELYEAAAADGHTWSKVFLARRFAAFYRVDDAPERLDLELDAAASCNLLAADFVSVRLARGISLPLDRGRAISIAGHWPSLNAPAQSP